MEEKEEEKLRKRKRKRKRPLRKEGKKPLMRKEEASQEEEAS